MCFPLYNCFCCISLDVGTKIIGIVSMVVNAGMAILFGVPITLTWKELPVSRAYFYTGMTVTSIALFVCAFLLVIAAFTNKPYLMRPWIATSFCVSVPLFLLSIGGMVTLSMRFVNSEMAAEEGFVISTYIVYALLLFYFCTVVNSRRNQLERQEEERSIERLFNPIKHEQNRDNV